MNSTREKYSYIIFVLLNLVSSVYSQKMNNEINPDYVKWLQGKTETFSSDGHALGEIPPPYKLPTELPDYLKKQLIPKETLPASFDLRTTGGLTSVKDQGQCGSCWAFATMGAIESRWKVNGRGTYDLSEDNLNTCHPPFVLAPCEGGNAYLSLAYLSRGSGPKSESDDPYSDSHTTDDCPSGLSPQGIITSGWFIPTTDPNLIKSLIQTYGALATDMYYTASSYNSGNHTYYYSGSESINHAVTLVGWDDTKATAGGTGAWIIKNSWGASWGENGYFYIAYQDSKVNSTVTLFKDYIDYNPNETISTYTESGWVSSVGYSSNQADALVKFIANGNVQLTKIGTWATYPGAIFSIEVYEDFNGSNSLTGLLGSLSNQTSTYSGYHTFNLTSPISISNGNDYYVKIRYQTTGYNYPVPFERYISGYTNPTIETGKNWLKSTGGSTWESLDSEQWDICIYAYSNTSGTPEIDIQRPPGTFIPDGGTDNVGGWALGTVSLPYTIVNTGTAPLSVSGVIATNLTNASGFTVVSPTLPFPVSVGGPPVILTVSVNLSAAGVFGFDMDIANNVAGSKNPYDIAVTGTGPVATPTFSPPAGTYTSVQSVTINCTTSGATIRYTTDGSDPTESSPAYLLPINIASTTTLKAKAYKTDRIPSEIESGTYTITIITITSPNGSENWQVGSSHDITWTASGTSGTVRIEYSANNGSSWSDVVANPGDGTYPWTVPNTPSTQCLVKITDTDGSPSDQSDGVFTISTTGQNVVTTVGCGDYFEGSQVTVPIDINMSGVAPPNEKLGSYTGTLDWNKDLLRYVSYTGGTTSGWSNPTVNASGTSTGHLGFAHANASGTTGTVNIINVTFDVIGTTGQSGIVDLGFSAMAAAGTFVNLKPFLTVQDCNYTIYPAGILGDVNGDDNVNSTDALIILSCDVGINVSQFCPMNCGDVNGDGLVNSTDALIILSYDVGIPVPFPVGQPGCPQNVTPCAGCN
jgi:C1A family cysteine protease